MVQLIGFIVATYAVARLLQVPYEQGGKVAHTFIGIVSGAAILIIAVLSVLLMFSGSSTPSSS